ncbi:MAG: GIY-YIG nuclease family protein [Waterburya sp.]
MKQKVFFTPQYPAEPKKGMGYIVINREIAKSIGITSIYQPIGYGGRMYVDSPKGRFTAYCDNPYGFGGRNKRRFKVYSHNMVIELVAQKKLTIDAVLYFVRSWAEEDAKIITPGKRTINLDKQTEKLPCYVYFILNCDSKAIKIGIAKNVKRRLASLQTSSCSELKLLGIIKAKSVDKAKKLEQSLHKNFDKLHIRGEWFKANMELLNYIHKFSN